MKISPELERIIDAVAEGKMHLIVAIATPPGAERAEQLRLCGRCAFAARELLPLIGGFERLPEAVAVELRVCELGVEKLAGRSR